jgi:energy-coupling factor transport system ATP-binding protein
MSKSKITLEHVSYTYSKGTPFEIKALDDVCLDIHEGTITGIIGHTGSGKSTMVQLFNGLTKPMEGRILLDGADIWEKPKEIGKIRFRVGLVMQYPEYQLFEETVAADIAYGPKNMGLSEEEIQRRVEDSARFVGLDPAVLSKSPFDLSGGQKRRAALAGIMAMRPEVLVLDEPAAGLDPMGRDAILNGICQYQQESGATVIIVSHSMEDMARYCDEIVVMDHAKVRMSGDRDEIFARSDELIDAGLDIPEITKMIWLLRSHGIEIDRSIYTVDRAEQELMRLFGQA